ncbi:MAG: hypothetical protein MUF00_21425, partial [Gemmatimonadaceae bacterium]|nr:hypothetical protein [Gemmatimonadaceae bacterium]
MESIIRELGITFLVGACAFLGAEMIAYQVFDFHVSGFFRGTWGFDRATEAPREERAGETPTVPLESAFDSGGNIRAAVFAGLAFALGVMVEDICHKFVDAGVIPPVRNDKIASRMDVLIVRSPSGILPTPLGRDLGGQKVFSRFELTDPRTAHALDSLFVTHDSQWARRRGLDLETVNGAINRLYYLAKNTVYQTSTGYEELQRIQSRLDFSRSLLVLFLLFFGSTVILVKLRLALAGFPYLPRSSDGRNA